MEPMDPAIPTETAAVEAPAEPPMEMPEEALVNVRDPDTFEIGSIPKSQLKEALAQGFSEPSHEEVHSFIQEQKYGSVGQQALTGLEGAASAATFGLSTGLETAAGIKPEDIQGRREENPITHMVGQGAGLVGTAAIPGLGAANLLEDVGRGVKAAVGIGEATTAAKIGSAAVKAAAENAAFQVGDEISKGFSQDPNQSLQTAIADVGLSALIGSGFGAGVGAISPIWDATAGPKVEGFLKQFADKAGGIEGIATEANQRALDKLSMKVAPEISATFSDNPTFRQIAKTLEQSDTASSGLEFQKTLHEAKRDLSDQLVGSLGRTTEDISSEISPYEAGKRVGNSLAEEFKAQIDPLAEKFEKIKETYADTPLVPDQKIETGSYDPYLGASTEKSMVPGTVTQIADKLGELVQTEGWYTSPSSEIMTEVNRVLKELPKQQTLKDLSNYITQIGTNTYDFTNPQLTRAGMMIKSIVRDAESEVITKALGEKAPELVAEHAAARAAWAKQAALKDSLQDRLHLGGGNSPTAFIKNLQEAAGSEGEKIIRKLSGTNDAALLQMLQEKFPQTAELVKQYHLDELLRKNSKQVGDNRIVSANKLTTAIEKMSPELKSFALPADALEKVRAVSQLMHHLEELPHNFPNTARTFDKLLNYLPGSAVAMVSMLSGHPLMGLVLGPLTKYLGRDVPDALRLGMLKFMGSSKQINAQGFKAMVDYIQSTMKGESLISKGAKAIFKAGQEVLPQSVMPSRKDTEKLDKRLIELKGDPNPLMKMGGQTGHYLPEHAQAMGQTGAQAVNYLNSIRPSTDKKSPLDSEIKPSKDLEAAFHNALEIAQQPLLTLNKIKQGTLTTQDIVHLNAMYPQLYQKLQQKLTNEMVDSLAKGGSIPYKTRLGLSLFTGQALDSTMTPQAILATQPKMPGQSQFAQAQARQQHSTSSLSKMPGMYQSSSQAAEARRLK